MKQPAAAHRGARCAAAALPRLREFAQLMRHVVAPPRKSRLVVGPLRQEDLLDGMGWHVTWKQLSDLA